MRYFKFLFVALFILLIHIAQAPAADINLQWDASPGATSYRIYQSLDSGATWTGIDETTETQATILAVPDAGLVLFKVSAIRGGHEAVRDWSGAWYNGDWKPPSTPGGAGIQ